MFIADFESYIPASFDTVTSLCLGFCSERAAAGLGPSGLIKSERGGFTFTVQCIQTLRSHTRDFNCLQ